MYKLIKHVNKSEISPKLKLFKLSFEMCEEEGDKMFIELKMLEQGCQCLRTMSKYHNYELEYGLGANHDFAL